MNEFGARGLLVGMPRQAWRGYGGSPGSGGQLLLTAAKRTRW